MTEKHTPGPWNVTARFDNAYPISSVRAINTDGMVLAHVNATFDPDGANARLMSAAPDLLAALRYVLDCEQRGDFSDLQPVRDAIARAEVG